MLTLRSVADAALRGMREVADRRIPPPAPEPVVVPDPDDPEELTAYEVQALRLELATELARASSPPDPADR